MMFGPAGARMDNRCGPRCASDRGTGCCIVEPRFDRCCPNVETKQIWHIVSLGISDQRSAISDQVRHLAPGTWLMFVHSLGIRDQVRHLAPGTWHPAPDRWYLAPGTWHLA